MARKKVVKKIAPKKKKVLRAPKKNVLYQTAKVIHHGGKVLKNIKKIGGSISDVLKNLRVTIH